MRDLQLFSSYDVIYGFVKHFATYDLFGREVQLEDANTIRNLSETIAQRTIIETFKDAINKLTIQDQASALF